jgi:hypothetical protein
LFGIQNITNNNGWAMAAVGASIVFLGLVVLSFAISQIHKILKLWEEREKYLNRFKKQVQAVEEDEFETPIYKERHLPAVDELARTYEPLVQQLKAPFKLSQLFEITNKWTCPTLICRYNGFKRPAYWLPKGMARSPGIIYKKMKA